MFMLFVIGYIASHVMFIIGTIRRITYRYNLKHSYMTPEMRQFLKVKLRRHWFVTFLLIVMTIYAGLNF